MRVTYVEHSGVAHAIEVPIGESLMVGALRNRVPGILATCGGDCGCATCHVYVDPEWAGRTGAQEWREKRTLQFAFERRETSRLACQIRATEDLDGLIVRLPRRQF